MGVRLAPLRILEHSLLKSVWRGGNLSGGDVVCKNVRHLKAIVYALHRRVTGAPRTKWSNQWHQPMDIQAAKEDLTKMKIKLGPFCTLSALSRALTGEYDKNHGRIDKEWNPMEYEKFLCKEVGYKKDDIFLIKSEQWSACLQLVYY